MVTKIMRVGGKFLYGKQRELKTNKQGSWNFFTPSFINLAHLPFLTVVFIKALRVLEY